MDRAEQVAEQATSRARGWIGNWQDNGTQSQEWEVEDSITFGGMPAVDGYPHPITVLPNTGFLVGYCE